MEIRKELLQRWAERIGVGIFALTALLYVLPGALGFAYPFVTLPLYGISCMSSSTSADKSWVPLSTPISPENYSLFLRNQGCTIDEALRIQELRDSQFERQCRERIGSAEYDRLKQHASYGEYSIAAYCGGYSHFWGDDWISQGFANVGERVADLMVSSFMIGLSLGVTAFTDLYNANVLVRVLLLVAYALATGFAMTMLTHLATDTYNWLRTQVQRSRDPDSDGKA